MRGGCRTPSRPPSTRGCWSRQRRGRRGRGCANRCGDCRSGPDEHTGRPNLTGVGEEEHEVAAEEEEEEEEEEVGGCLHIDPGMGEPDPPTPTPKKRRRPSSLCRRRNSRIGLARGRERMQRAEPPPSLPSVGFPVSSSGGGRAKKALGRDLRRRQMGPPGHPRGRATRASGLFYLSLCSTSC